MSSRMPNPRPGLLPALLLVVAVALAGCVGIPSSGRVTVGGEITDAGGTTSFADLPLGPPRGASKQVILTDFMQAATSPDNDYAIAKLFLTTQAAQKWVPTKSVLIRQGIPTLRTDADGSIDYAVSTRGSVDASGTYSQQSTPSTQALNFSFRKVAGQWRIAGLPDGTVVSATSFAQVFSEQALYFFDPSFHYLVPDIRYFPSGSTEPTRIVSALLGGPSNWLQQNVVASAFPQNVELASSVVVRSGAAVVDLSAVADATRPIDRSRMQQQLQESLQDVSVNSVTMTVRGAPFAVPDATGSDAVNALAVDGAALVGDGKRFGFAPQMRPIAKLSAQILALGASAVTVDRAQSSAAVLAHAGVFLVSDSAAKPLLLDTRGGLIPPSIDPFGFVWSAPGSDATALLAFAPDGSTHPIASAIPSRSTIVALAVSHEGARILLYLDTPSGPVLAVAGIQRRGTVPIAIGPLLQLPVSSDAPVDATWVDDRSVASLSDSNGVSSVTTFVIAGTVSAPSSLDAAARIVGGSTADGVRVLTLTGEVQQLRSSGWQNTGLSATLLGTQQ